jgi:hypothetical protein
MLYKALGVLVWRGARWYVRRRYGTAPGRAGMAGAAALAAAGAIAARRRAALGEPA